MMSEEIPRRRSERPEVIALPDTSHLTPEDSRTQHAIAEVVADTQETPAAESEPGKKRFVSTRENGIQKFYVIDAAAAPEQSIIEPVSGERLRAATTEETDQAIQQLASRDPEGPRAMMSPPEPPRQPRRRAERTGATPPPLPAEAARAQPAAIAEATTPTAEAATADSVAPAEAASVAPEAPAAAATERTPHKVLIIARNELRGALREAGAKESPRAGNGIRGTEAVQQSKEKKDRWAYNERDYVGIEKIPLKRLLADPEHSVFFGLKLRSLISNDLDVAEPEVERVIERYMNGKATQEEMSMMAFATNEYLKWNHVWEKLTADLTPEDVAFFRRRNTDMKNVIAHVGPDEGIDTFKNMLRHMAARNAKGFQAIEEFVREMHHVRHSLKGKILEGKIHIMAQKIGVSREEFDDVMNLSTQESYEATKDDIEGRLRDKGGLIRTPMDWMDDKANAVLGKIPEVTLPSWLFHGKTVNFRNLYLPGSSRRGAVKLTEKARSAMAGSFGKTGKMLNHLEHEYDHVDTYISDVMGNREVYEQIQKNTLKNEMQKSVAETGPASFSAAKEAAEKVDEKKVETFIREEIKKYPTFASGTPEYRSSVMSDIKRDAVKKQQKGFGFWSWFVNALFINKFDQAAKKAQKPEAQTNAAPAAAHT